MYVRNTYPAGLVNGSFQYSISSTLNGSGQYTWTSPVSNVNVVVGGINVSGGVYWAGFVAYFSGTHTYDNLSFSSSGGFSLSGGGANALIFGFSGPGATNFALSLNVFYTTY
jgi:hypothetical protein